MNCDADEQQLEEQEARSSATEACGPLDTPVLVRHPWDHVDEDQSKDLRGSDRPFPCSQGAKGFATKGLADRPDTGDVSGICGKACAHESYLMVHTRTMGTDPTGGLGASRPTV